MKEKSSMKRALKLVFVCLMCSVIFAGLNTQSVMAASKKSITLNESSKTLTVGKTTTIKVKKVKGLKSKEVTFKSSNNKIATVSSKGVVKGVKEGSATITVTSKEDKKVTTKFKVKVVKSSTEDFFKENNVNIRKVGTTYTQKGIGFVENGKPSIYNVKTEVKYEGVYPWEYNKNYYVVDLMVDVKYPKNNEKASIYWRNALYDLTGKQVLLLPPYQPFENKKRMQLGMEIYVDTDMNEYWHAYIFYSALIPKNKGAYFMFGGYDSADDLKNVLDTGNINKRSEGGYHLKKDDLSKSRTYFYISVADAQKALKK